MVPVIITAMQQAAPVLTPQPSGVPTWWILATIFAPGALAQVLTIATGVAVRRMNRDALKRPPMNPLAVIWWVLGAGAVWGPLCQWGLQEVVQMLTGFPPIPKLIIVGAFITGPISLVLFEAACWWSQERHPRLYALLKVRHEPARGHVGETTDGDLTAVGRNRSEKP